MHKLSASCHSATPERKNIDKGKFINFQGKMSRLPSRNLARLEHSFYYFSLKFHSVWLQPKILTLILAQNIEQWIYFGTTSFGQSPWNISFFFAPLFFEVLLKKILSTACKQLCRAAKAENAEKESSGWEDGNTITFNTRKGIKFYTIFESIALMAKAVGGSVLEVMWKSSGVI